VTAVGGPLWSPYKIGCKVAKLHNSCTQSMASHSWCQITPLTQSCIMSSGIPPPIYRCSVATALATKTAAARNAPVNKLKPVAHSEIKLTQPETVLHHC